LEAAGRGFVKFMTAGPLWGNAFWESTRREAEGLLSLFEKIEEWYKRQSNSTKPHPGQEDFLRRRGFLPGEPSGPAPVPWWKKFFGGAGTTGGHIPSPIGAEKFETGAEDIKTAGGWFKDSVGQIMAFFGIGGGAGAGGGAGGGGGGGGAGFGGTSGGAGGQSGSSVIGGRAAAARAGRAGGGSAVDVPNVGPMTAEERNNLGLILKYESKGQNVMNYMGRRRNLDPTTPKGYTAQGYYQILNSNWNRIAPGLGINTPNAMASSLEDQTKVALALMREPGQKVGHWANYNPALRAALARGEQFTGPGQGGGQSEGLIATRQPNGNLGGKLGAALKGEGLFATSGLRDWGAGRSHQEGRGFDVRARSGEQADAAIASIDRIMAANGLVKGVDYRTVDEVRGGSPMKRGPHVHAEFLSPRAKEVFGESSSMGAIAARANAARSAAGRMVKSMGITPAMAKEGVPLPPSRPVAPSSVNNSKSISLDANFTTNIHANGADPDKLATSFQKASRGVYGEAVGNYVSRVR
jgi:hypothetical protein